jgi:hypothetical protein
MSAIRHRPRDRHCDINATLGLSGRLFCLRSAAPSAANITETLCLKHYLAIDAGVPTILSPKLLTRLLHCFRVLAACLMALVINQPIP